MRRKQLKLIKKISLSVALCAVFIAVAFLLFKRFYREFSSFEDNDYSKKYFVRGIDLSHHNPIINWDAAREDNITFAYLKSTEGVSHEDRNYKYNYKLAKQNNIRIGTYHFYSFGISGSEQAKHFIRNAKCESGDLIPAIDVEHSPSNVYSKDTTYMGLVIKELKILEDELFNYYGVRPVIYTNKDCYKLYIKGNFENNPIWLCDLHNEPSEKEVKNWIIWQFSHTGKIAGLKENVDLNYFRYTYNELKQYLIP